MIRFELAISVERKRARSVIRDDPDSASAPIDPDPVVPILRTVELVRLLRSTSPTAAVTQTSSPASTAERTWSAVVAVVAPATHDGCPSGGSGETGGGPTGGAGGTGGAGPSGAGGTGRTRSRLVSRNRRPWRSITVRRTRFMPTVGKRWRRTRPLPLPSLRAFLARSCCQR